MIHVYTGDGKGKSTAALGLALRAIGNGMRVVVMQFMKGSETGEVLAQEIIPGLCVAQYGRDAFVDPEKPLDEDYDFARQGFQCAKDVVSSGSAELLILDEINVAVDYGLLPKKEVVEFIKSVPESVELVLTGRNAPSEFVELADLVTEMKEIKHPYKKGVKARKGVEY